MRRFLKYFVIILLISCNLTVFAQKLEELRFNPIGVDHGFIGQTFYEIFEDSQRMIWFGGNGGIYSWDGFRMTPYLYSIGDSTSLSSAEVRAICEIDVNRLAIATISGVNIFNKSTGKFSVIPCSDGKLVLSVCVDKNKNLWFGTNEGLFFYDIKTNSHINYTSKSPSGQRIADNYLIGLRNSDDEIIIGTHNHVSFCDIKTKLITNHKMPIDCGIVISIIKSREHLDCYWVGTDEYLFLWNRQTGYVEKKLSGNPIKTIIYDKDDNLWVGTDNGLLLLSEGEKEQKMFLHYVDDSHSIPSNIVWKTFVDAGNNLWVATTNGVSVASIKNVVKDFSLKNIYSLDQGMQLFGISKHKDDVAFCGTSGVLLHNSVLNQNIWLHVDAPTPRHKITHNRTRYAYLDNDNVCWIATDLGLNSYDLKKDVTRSYNIVESTGKYKSVWMYCIAEKDGFLYISTYDGGIFVVNKSDLIKSAPNDIVVAFKHYSSTSDSIKIPTNIVNALIVDKSKIYATTHNSGMFVIDEQSKEVKQYRYDDIASDFINTAILFKNDVLAIVYPKFVELLYSGGGRQIIFESNSSNISSAVKYGDSKLFLSTFNEIIVLDIVTGNYKSINLSLLNVTPIQSIFYDSITNQIYWGGIDRFGTINVEAINENSQSRKPTITNLLFNDNVVLPNAVIDEHIVLPKQINQCDTVVLQWPHNTFSLEFSSMDYSLLSSQKYMYRLKGLSDEWILNAPGNNKATFVNIPYGTYVFEVALQEGLHVNGENIRRLTVIIKPPFYKSKLAYLVYFLLVGFSLYGFYRYIRHRQKQIIKAHESEENLKFTQMKIDFMTNTSHELKTPLLLILSKLSTLIINEKNADKRLKLLSIQNSVEQIKNLTLNNLREFHDEQSIKDNLHFRPVDITVFVKSVCDSFADQLAAKEINFEFEQPNKPIYVMIDNNQFWAVIENLISNAIKYSDKGGEVKVVVKPLNNNQVDISVTDNGCGIDQKDIESIFERNFKVSPENDGHGLGLSIAKEIVKSHIGEIKVVSTLGQGSTFTIMLYTVKNSEHRDVKQITTDKNLYNILIVEDNDEMLNFLYEGLSENFTCVKANKVSAGFDVALDIKPSLIVCGFEMLPDSGLALVEKVRDNIFISSIPIIIVSSHSDKASQIESYSKGADEFLIRPVDLNDLSLRAWQLIQKNEIQLEKRRQQDLASGPVTKVVSVDDKFINLIATTIEENMSDSEFSLNQLCEACSMSNKQVYRRLKQLTGLTPTEYIRDIRLKRAAKLLSEGRYSVSEVLFKVGFANPSYFTKCFKMQFNVTPSEYLENSKEKVLILRGENDND